MFVILILILISLAAVLSKTKKWKYTNYEHSPKATTISINKYIYKVFGSVILIFNFICYFLGLVDFYDLLFWIPISLFLLLYAFFYLSNKRTQYSRK